MANLQAIMRAAWFTPSFKGRWGLVLDVEGKPGCLHGDTPIHDPEDGSTKTVRQRWRDGVGFHVWAMSPHGPVVTAAMPPHKYKPAQMVEVNGCIKVTMGHRFLTTAGWRQASELSQRSEHAQLLSSSDTYLQAHAQDALRWSQTTPGSLDDYRFAPSFGGAPPPQEASDGLALSPIQDGARGRSHVDSRRDAQACAEERTLTCPPPDPPTTQGCQIQNSAPWRSAHPTAQPHQEQTSQPERAEHSYQAGTRPLQSSDLLGTGLPRAGDAQVSTVAAGDGLALAELLGKAARASQDTIGAAQAQLALLDSTEPYYDFHVPVYENYWACGLWHHNTGKTSEIEALAASVGMHCEVVLAALREPVDFLGLFILDGDGNTRNAPPEWAKRCAALGRAVVYFDELNTAPPAVQNALMRVLYEGCVGDLRLPNGIRFVNAQNSVTDAAGGWDLVSPLANRMGHLSWPEPSVAQWTDYMLSSDEATAAEDPSEIESFVLEFWAHEWALARGEVTAFMRTRPILLHKQPSSGSAARGKAWPSHRSWEAATRALASSRVHKLSQIDTDEFMAAYVGNAAAAEFAQWRSTLDLPNPDDVLDGRVAFKHDPRRLDRTAALLQSCTLLVSPKDSPRRDARTGKLWEVIGDLIDTSPDVVVPSAAALARVNTDALRGANGRTVVTVMGKLAPILQAAGVQVR